MKRKEFSRKQRAEIFLRAKGVCGGCEARLKVGEGEIDHILPIALGGETEVENGQVLCAVCHKGKTCDDVRRIRKSDRQRDKHTGAIKKKGFWQFGGRLKKKIDGTVVDRETGEKIK